MSNLNFEIHRKTFHLMGLLCPVIYFFISKYIAAPLMIFAAAFVVYIDINRHKNQLIQYWVNYFLGNIMRTEESRTRKLASCSWMFLGLAISCILFPKNIAIFSWVILFISDSAAALVGTKYGRTFILDKKTFEGSLTFFIITIILGMFIYLLLPASFSFFGLVVCAILTTYTELYSKYYGIDDNISIPLVAGLCLSIF